jgi:phage terminase small subunit
VHNNNLTPKQRKFIAFYEGNATQAAIKAGYSKKTARAQGSLLLTKIDIKEALKKREAKELAPTIADRKERQEFWSNILRGKIKKAKLMDRLKASELLGKSEADFIEKVEHSGNVNLFADLKLDTEPMELLKQLNERLGLQFKKR